MSDLPRLEVGMQVIVFTDYSNGCQLKTVDRVTAKRAYIGDFVFDRDTWNAFGYNLPRIRPVTPELMERAERQRITNALQIFPLDDLSVDQLRRIHQIMEEGK